MTAAPSFVSPDAVVDAGAKVGAGASIWDAVKVRTGAVVGDECIVGRGAFIDAGVRIGARCKIQNNALIYAPARLADGVFIGPAATLTNDRYPRAVNPDGSIKSGADWTPAGVTVHTGAAIGAAAVVVGGVTIGEWSMVGAGSVVTTDVPAHALVAGSPARRIAWIGRSGRPLVVRDDELRCPETDELYRLDGDALVLVGTPT